jgi:hypothetical protein
MRIAHTLREAAPEVKQELPPTQRGEPGQTFAVSEREIAPGVRRRTTTAARQDSPGSRSPRTIRQPEIDRYLDDMNRDGLEFRFDNPRQKFHAEVKQSVTRPDEPIDVDRPMCPSCQRFKSVDAVHRGRPQVVRDPEAVRVFEPDGTVTEFWHNGEVWQRTQRIEPTPEGARVVLESYTRLL